MSARHKRVPEPGRLGGRAEQQHFYDDPVAVERKYPYTAVTKQWGKGDVDGGLHLVSSMSR